MANKHQRLQRKLLKRQLLLQKGVKFPKHNGAKALKWDSQPWMGATNTLELNKAMRKR